MRSTSVLEALVLDDLSGAALGAASIEEQRQQHYQ
jgi:hypothetical protein